MHKQRKNLKAVVAAGVVTGATLLAGSALTASNTVPDSQAGDGAGAITGYTVSAVSYDTNATDPTLIDEVSFTLDSTPVVGSEIRVQVDSTGGTWFTCSNVLADVTCDTSATPPNVADADQLRVIAVD